MPSSAVQKRALRSEEHTSELQSHDNLVCRLLIEQKKQNNNSSHKSVATTLPTLRCPRASVHHISRQYIVSTPRCSTGQFYHWYILFFFNDTATTEIYTLSLHDALPI